MPVYNLPLFTSIKSIEYIESIESIEYIEGYEMLIKGYEARPVSGYGHNLVHYGLWGVTCRDMS